MSEHVESHTVLETSTTQTVDAESRPPMSNELEYIDDTD